MIDRTAIDRGNAVLQVSEFCPESGAKEYHLMIAPSETGSFYEQLCAVNQALADFRNDHDEMDPDFVRYFVSDASNQEQLVKDTASELNCPVSVIEQPLLSGRKVSAWVYLVKRDCPSEYRQIWHASMKGCGPDSCSQTDSIFRNYADTLAKEGCTIPENCIRTWLLVQNVDVNYAGVVKGRRGYFDEIGLTKDTHYIASTGIAGRTAESTSKVMMDAYAVDGLAAEQITYLKGATHLNPTHEYGVTFERGTSVDYGDRRHVFISGTASIDNKGEIVHPGDIGRQTLRMLENVEVLLAEAECTFDDVMHMIVYLRDIADHAQVSSMFRERFPEHPKVFVWAPVCRPGWLVEMECMAVRQIENKEYKPF